MVDVIVVVMVMEDKEFYKVGELVVVVMIEIVIVIIGDVYKVIILQIIENNFGKFGFQLMRV